MGLGSRRMLLTDGVFAAAMVGAVGWWGLRIAHVRDFALEAQPAVERLLAGDLHGFLARSPVYSGSMVLRAPIMALAPDPVAAYRFGAVACVVVLAVLAVGLVGSTGRRALPARWLVVAALVANPVVALALQYGHPEDVLASGLAVGGLLWAIKGRSVPAGVLLGMAVASKQWAAIALPIAVAASPSGRVRLGLAAGTSAALVLAPVAAVAASSFVSANRAVATVASGFALPDNLWWLLGAYRPLPGKEHSLLFAPAPSSLAAHVSRPLILLVPVVLGVTFMWRRPRWRLVAEDALLLLAAAGLLRCTLDPWNVVYYHLPFLMALLAWETRRRTGPPLLSVAATGLVWLTFQTLPSYASRDMVTSFYMAWATLAVAAMVGWALGLRLSAFRRKSCATQQPGGTAAVASG